MARSGLEGGREFFRVGVRDSYNEKRIANDGRKKIVRKDKIGAGGRSCTKLEGVACTFCGAESENMKKRQGI
jgi:hypothetical protein